MKRTAVWLMVLTIISKCMGFVRDIILAKYYGASAITDAYLVAMTIPGTVAAFIGVAVSTGYIPLYSQIRERDGEQAADRFTNQVLTGVLVLCAILLVGMEMFAVPIVKLFAFGFEGETLTLAVRFTRITLFGVLSFGVMYIMKSYLQSNDKYILPGLVGVPFNLISIGFIVLSSQLHVMYLALGAVLAEFSQILILLPGLIRRRFRYRWSFSVQSPAIRRMLTLALPTLLGASVHQVNILVDRTLASKITEGGITALILANLLNLFIQGVFVISICTVLYPALAKLAVREELNKMKQLASEAWGSIALFVMPATVGALLFSKPIIRLLFQRGAFDERAVSLTAGALFFYSLGMLAMGIREVMYRIFYAVQDTKTPMMNAAASMIINIILNVVLSHYMGIDGLALATSCAALIGVVLCGIQLRKVSVGFISKKLWVEGTKITVASLLMGLSAFGCFQMLLLPIGERGAFISAVAIGALTYTCLILLFRVEAVRELITFFNKRGTAV